MFVVRSLSVFKFYYHLIHYLSCDAIGQFILIILLLLIGMHKLKNRVSVDNRLGILFYSVYL